MIEPPTPNSKPAGPMGKLVADDHLFLTSTGHKLP